MYENINRSNKRRPSTLTAVCLVGTLLMTGEVALADAVLPSGMPVTGYISSKFGLRKSPFSGQIEFHRGVDIPARRGSKVVATADGKVTQAGWQGACGRSVTLRHASGFDTQYCHLDQVRVLVGEQIRQGEAIGTVGSTGRSAGPHLHYSVSRNGKSLDPDPFLRTGRTRGPRIGSPRRVHASKKIVANVVWNVRRNSEVEIPDAYADLLRQAGWLDYVIDNIDQLDFVKAHILVLNDGRRAVGVATVIRGRRMAQVVTLGLSPSDIAKVIVHEAGHLEPWLRSRRQGSEDYAVRVAAKFSKHLKNAQARANVLTQTRQDVKRLQEGMKKWSGRMEAQGRNIRDVKSRIEGLWIQSIQDRKRLESRVESQERDVREIKRNQKLIIEGLNRLETLIGQTEGARNSRREFNRRRGPDTVPLRGAVQAPEAEGQRRLCLAYYYGEDGVRRDYRQAAKCFRQAAEQGDATAELYMGLLHLDGEGVQQDYQQAVRWFRRATHQGNARGQYYLALCYYYGKGIRRDYKEAIRWFRRAAQQGHAPSQGFLGI